MKITKLSVIIFIFLLGISLAPNIGVSSTDVSNQGNDFGPTTDQAATPNVLTTEFVNASITQIQRNVTAVTSGLISLEDQFTLNILDDDTQIATLNYSVPTDFTSQVHEVRFFTQFGDNIGLDAPNNTRPYTVFYGSEVTTYQIDIRQDGEPANSSSDGVYVQTTLNALNLVDIVGRGSGQRGTFPTPITPMFPNLDTEDALVTISLQGSEDKYVRPEINRLTNSLDEIVPIFTDVENVITYNNMSRDSFDYRFGLQEGDLEIMTFDSVSPISVDEETGALTALVPSVLSDAQRTVRFDPWGTVYVKEEITLLHQGAPYNESRESYFDIHQVSSYFFTVSEDAQLTRVYDRFGTLTQGRDRDEDGFPDSGVSPADSEKQEFRVDFRNPIFGGQSYTFTVEYKFNASSIIASENDVYTMNTTLFSDYNVTASNMDVRYEFPVGTTFVGHTYSSNSRFVNYQITSEVHRNPLSAFNHFELVFQMTNASYVDNVGFQIMFTYTPIGNFQNIAMYFYITLALLAFAYALSNITYKPSKAVEIEKALIPINEMDTFFNYFSEKSGAEKRIAELRNRRVKGKLSKKDYDGQVKAIRRRLRDINPQLENAAKNLSKHGGRYENYVKRVMLASQRQSDIRRNAREAKLSYERGNIPKDIYQLRIKEFNEDLKKQETIINKTLTEMVEVIQKFNQ